MVDNTQEKETGEEKPKARRFSPTIALLIFFVVIDGMALYAAYVKKHRAFTPITFTEPAPAPNFVWKSFSGKDTHRLGDLAGHAVVLHFWAAWCPPCRDEFPKMLKLAAANPDIMFLTVAGDSAPEKPEEFVKKAAETAGVKPPPNVLYAWDPTKAITYDEFMTVSFPESIFIDANQKMRRKYPTPIDWEKPEIINYLNELKGAAGK